MKPFEIPYNFDIQLINFLKIYRPSNFDIASIYIAPFRYHYQSAKYYYTQIPLISLRDIKEYEKHIQYIQNFFPNKLRLLLQRNKELLSKDLLKYYISLGISKFCVGSIEQANEIKLLLPTADIMGSITMKIDKNKLNTNLYDNIFNSFVLWFPFNRNITAIQELPTNFSYILLINCTCSIFCQGTQHWLAQTKKDENFALSKCPQQQNHDFKNIIFIPTQDLKYFEPFVSAFKLQGREYNTTKIIQDIVYYTSEDYNKHINEKYDINKIYNIKK